jgi:hypothetical protein
MRHGLINILFTQIKCYYLLIYQTKSGTHGHIGISKPHQKNQACELMEHTRPRSDATYTESSVPGLNAKKHIMRVGFWRKGSKGL